MSESGSTATPYHRLGEEEGVRRLVVCFYDAMDALPEAKTIRDLHAEDLAPMVDKLAVFLTGWLGGPERYREQFGRIVIPAAHEPFSIGGAERDQWLLCMQHALVEVEADDDLIAMLMPSFAAMADMCRTRSD
jgi:hemoglobin